MEALPDPRTVPAGLHAATLCAAGDRSGTSHARADPLPVSEDSPLPRPSRESTDARAQRQLGMQATAPATLTSQPCVLEPPWPPENTKINLRHTKTNLRHRPVNRGVAGARQRGGRSPSSPSSSRSVRRPGRGPRCARGVRVGRPAGGRGPRRCAGAASPRPGRGRARRG